MANAPQAIRSSLSDDADREVAASCLDQVHRAEIVQSLARRASERPANPARLFLGQAERDLARRVARIAEAIGRSTSQGPSGRAFWLGGESNCWRFRLAAGGRSGPGGSQGRRAGVIRGRRRVAGLPCHRHRSGYRALTRGRARLADSAEISQIRSKGQRKGRMTSLRHRARRGRVYFECPL